MRLLENSTFHQLGERSVNDIAFPGTLASSFMKSMGHRISACLKTLEAERTANVRAKGTGLASRPLRLARRRFRQYTANRRLLACAHDFLVSIDECTRSGDARVSVDTNANARVPRVVLQLRRGELLAVASNKLHEKRFDHRNARVISRHEKINQHNGSWPILEIPILEYHIVGVKDPAAYSAEIPKRQFRP